MMMMKKKKMLMMMKMRMMMISMIRMMMVGMNTNGQNYDLYFLHATPLGQINHLGLPAKSNKDKFPPKPQVENADINHGGILVDIIAFSRFWHRRIAAIYIYL